MVEDFGCVQDVCADLQTGIITSIIVPGGNNKLLNIFASTDYRSIPIYMRNTFKNIVNEDLSNYLKNIKEETLILWGELDKDTPLKYGHKINKLINNSAIITLSNASHFSYLDYPFLTNKIIKEFLK